MAITNAQQYKQLVNPPLDGKRPGYRGDDAARSSEGTSAGRADPGGAGRGDTRGSPGPADDRGSDRQNYNQKVVSGRLSDEDYETFDEVPLNKREQEFENFLNRRNEVNIPKLSYLNFIKGPLQKFSDFNASINRPFFEKVIRAGKIPGLNFDMTEDELENAYQNYMSERLAGNIDAYGNPLNTGNDGGGADIMSDYERRLLELEKQNAALKEQATTPTTTQNPFAYRFMADGGIMNADIVGGMMDGNMDEMGRQMYGLGKLVKKVTRGVKKIVKSPIGKIALGAAAFKFGMPFLKSEGFKNFFLKDKLKGFALDNLSKKGLMTGIGALSALPFIFQGDEEEEYDPYRGPDIDIANIRSDPYAAMGQAYRFAADGGITRPGYQEGGDAEPVAKKTMPLIDMDGKEKDYRETGGFVDMGRMERADDVPARLSKNEFVFTADAVRNAGEGDIDKGAEVMYNMMKNLEAGGEVSEESQGLEGARNMFQTSQRLGEVI